VQLCIEDIFHLQQKIVRGRNAMEQKVKDCLFGWRRNLWSFESMVLLKNWQWWETLNIYCFVFCNQRYIKSSHPSIYVSNLASYLCFLSNKEPKATLAPYQLNRFDVSDFVLLTLSHHTICSTAVHSFIYILRILLTKQQTSLHGCVNFNDVYYFV
jgi:hypothetical protein